MKWLESMNESLAYIEAHLEDEIDYEEVAKAACCSSYHYQRMFSLITNISLGEYIRRRRLSLAAMRLQSTSDRIIDIALRYGYQSPTAFTRAFMNMQGMSPVKAREKGIKLKLFAPISFSVSIKGEQPLNYRIEEKQGFSLVGIKQSIRMEDEQNFILVPKFWKDIEEDGRCRRMIQLVDQNDGSMYGVCTNFRDNEFDYYAAVKSGRDDLQDLSRLEINAGMWVVFECNGIAQIQDVFKRIYTDWFPTSGYEHSGGAEIEWYPPGDSSQPDYLCEVWIPIKKRLDKTCTET